MKYDIRYRPAFAAIFVTLEPREKITAEAGAKVLQKPEPILISRILNRVVNIGAIHPISLRNISIE